MNLNISNAVANVPLIDLANELSRGLISQTCEFVTKNTRGIKRPHSSEVLDDCLLNLELSARSIKAQNTNPLLMNEDKKESWQITKKAKKTVNSVTTFTYDKFSSPIKRSIAQFKFKFFICNPLMSDIACALESFGPIGVKVGQMIAVMDDVPEEDRKHFMHLCHNIKNNNELDIGVVEKRINKTIEGTNIQLISVDPKPIGRGSIADVYKAKIMKDGINQICAVKVVRREAPASIEHGMKDIQLILDFIGKYVDKDMSKKLLYSLTGLNSIDDKFDSSVLESYFSTMMNECNMSYEHCNIKTYQKALNDLSINNISLPEIYFGNGSVLGMEFISGETLSEIYQKDSAKADFLYAYTFDKWLEIDKHKNIIFADLHPGNIILKANDDKSIKDHLVFIDAGTVMKSCMTTDELNDLKESIVRLYRREHSEEDRPDLLHLPNNQKMRVDYFKQEMKTDGFGLNRPQSKVLNSKYIEDQNEKEINEIVKVIYNKFIVCYTYGERDIEDKMAVIKSSLLEAVNSECVKKEEGFDDKSIRDSDIISHVLKELKLSSIYFPDGYSHYNQSFARMKKFNKKRECRLVSDQDYVEKTKIFEKQWEDKSEVVPEKINHVSVKDKFSKASPSYKQKVFKWFLQRQNKNINLDDVNKIRKDAVFKNESVFQDWVICNHYQNNSLKEKQENDALEENKLINERLKTEDEERRKLKRQSKLKNAPINIRLIQEDSRGKSIFSELSDDEM